jgi:hypothetical protein
LDGQQLLVWWRNIVRVVHVSRGSPRRGQTAFERRHPIWAFSLGKTVTPAGAASENQPYTMTSLRNRLCGGCSSAIINVHQHPRRTHRPLSFPVAVSNVSPSAHTMILKWIRRRRSHVMKRRERGAGPFPRGHH